MVNVDIVGCGFFELFFFVILFMLFIVFICFLTVNISLIYYDMITRIRNSNLVKSRSVVVLRTNLSFNVCQILKQEGFIDSFEEFGDVIFTETGFFHKFILVTLKYKGVKQKPYITYLKRVSKPGFRVYVNQNNVPKVLGGVGVAIRLF